MRPVTRGGPPTYPYVVDVGSQANLDTSLAAISVVFGGKSIKKITAVWGTSSPTASQVLDGLLLIAKDNVGGLPPPKKKAKGVPTLVQVSAVKATLDTKLATLYGLAAGDLEGMLGRYCSFCELFNQTGVAVEHLRPKAQYPLFYIAWDNFLLACSVCNSNKLSRPPRDDALFIPAPADEVGYYTTIQDTYLWPHSYNGVYRATKPQLEYLSATTNTWKPVAYPIAKGTELTKSDERTRTHYADVLVSVAGGTKKDWRYDAPVRVHVGKTGLQSGNMVDDLVRLNKPSSNDKKPGAEADIRVWTRTKQWFDVLGSCYDLMTADATSFQPLWNVMMKSVQQPGLYSVWVTVIDLLGPGGSWTVPGTATTVMDKFLATIIGQGYFPGTDTADTP